MIRPGFMAQDQLFVPGPAFLLKADDPYRLFAQKVLPVLVEARPVLAGLYCAHNGRPCIEPVLLAALSLLQFWERVPDAQAVELLNYHLGWAYAVGWEIGHPLFHSSALSRFRQALLQHQQASLLFDQIIKGLVQDGVLKKNSARRLDSTFVVGLLSHMGRLECVRETLRLALRELAAGAPSAQRPSAWPQWWERYVESKLDFRTEPQVLAAKLRDCGQDAAQMLTWLEQNRTAPWAQGAQVQLLRRVVNEQFEPCPQTAMPPMTPSAPAASSASPTLQPKEKLPAGAVKNPHDPEAQWAKKGSGAHKKEVVGYKVQVCETVSEQPLPPRQPTPQFLTAIETQRATASDERGLELVRQAEARLNLAPAPVTYVDAAYVSGAQLAQAQAQGRELIGPVPAPPSRDGRFSAAAFDIHFDPLQARCPAGQVQAHFYQWQDRDLGGLATRFDWESNCQACALRAQCLSPNQASRTLAIGPHHALLQQRRREQGTPEFRQRCKHRNALEGTQSELVRAHGLRHARYRGLEKVRLQNYLIGAACNTKRWMRLLQWRARQTTPAVGTDHAKN